MEIKKFKDSLIDLRTILEVIKKIEISERLEIEKIEEVTKKQLEKLEIIIYRLEVLERKISFTALKERPNSIEEELRLRKITRKEINDIEKLETEIKEMEELKIKKLEDKSSKLLGDLNMEKGFEIDRIKKIEIKLKKLKIPKTIVDTITESIISKKYMYHILRFKNIAVIGKLKSW